MEGLKQLIAAKLVFVALAKRILFCLGLALISFTTLGQGYTFKVLASKGQNKIRSGSSWEVLKTGSALKNEDELKVSENSYLGLVHSSGKPLEIKKAGSYKIDDLSGALKGEVNLASKYVDFILSKNDEKKNRLSATGAVHRGLNDILLFIPKEKNRDIFNSTINIVWEAPPNSGPYLIVIKNVLDDLLLEVETAQQVAAINISDPKLRDELSLIVQIKSMKNADIKSPPCFMKKLDAGQREIIHKEIAELGFNIQNETALGNFLLAGFYEEKKLLIDAVSAYSHAIRLEPSYQEAYESFLVRNGLTDLK